MKESRYTYLLEESEGKHNGNLAVDGRIILEWIIYIYIYIYIHVKFTVVLGIPLLVL